MAGSFFAELKRRNILQVAFAYVAGAWLIVQAVETLFPVFGLSDAAIRMVVIALAIGFLLSKHSRVGDRTWLPPNEQLAVPRGGPLPLRRELSARPRGRRGIRQGYRLARRVQKKNCPDARASRVAVVASGSSGERQ
jgi:hypothetical protein